MAEKQLEIPELVRIFAPAPSDRAQPQIRDWSQRRMSMIRFNALLVSMLLLLSLGMGCSKKDPDKDEASSGAEKTGEAIDEAAEDTGEGAKEATDDVGDAVEEAGDEADDKL